MHSFIKQSKINTLLNMRRQNAGLNLNHLTRVKHKLISMPELTSYTGEVCCCVLIVLPSLLHPRHHQARPNENKNNKE